MVLRHSHLQNSSSKASNSSSLEQIIEVLPAERPRSGRSFDSAARSRAAFSSRSSRSIWLSSIPSSSSCSKLHPKLNSPFLSDAFCDQFHPWRREANLKCVVSIDTSSLHDKFCASSAHPKGPCLSRSACWLPNLVVTASTVVHCMTTDMPRAAVKGSTIFFVPKTSTAPPFFPWPA